MENPHCIVCQGCPNPCECDEYPLGFLVVCRDCYRAGEDAMLAASRDKKGVR